VQFIQAKEGIAQETGKKGYNYDFPHITTAKGLKLLLVGG
jgi:hypothetical protein